jgi:hypothetical protein
VLGHSVAPSALRLVHACIGSHGELLGCDTALDDGPRCHEDGASGCDELSVELDTVPNPSQLDQCPRGNGLGANRYGATGGRRPRRDLFCVPSLIATKSDVSGALFARSCSAGFLRRECRQSDRSPDDLECDGDPPRPMNGEPCASDGTREALLTEGELP